MAAVGAEEVRVLARLARLSVSSADAERFGEQLAQILGYVEQLQGVAVEGVPEYAEAQAHPGPMREDIVEPSLTAEDALAATPARRNDLVVVPKFKED